MSAAPPRSRGRGRASRSPVARLAGVPVGGAAPVVVMGVLNVSPESFHRGSVYDRDALLGAATAMIDAGASLVDVGAMSSAPYRAARVEAATERARLLAALDVLAGKVAVPISADTARAPVFAAALEAGASVLNDVTGLADPDLARLVARRGVSVIAMASPASADAGGIAVPPGADPVAVVRRCLAASLARARAAGVADERVVLDPGIGFFLDAPAARAAWDLAVLARCGELLDLGRPLAIGVSRKSLVGALTGRAEPRDRLAGSLAATALAVAAGVVLVRTHDVAETRDAVRVAERVARERA